MDAIKFISERTKELQKSRKWSLKELGDNSELAYMTIHDAVRSTGGMTIFTLEKLCNGLGIPMQEFFNDGVPNSYLNTGSEELLENYLKMSPQRRKLCLELSRALALQDDYEVLFPDTKFDNHR